MSTERNPYSPARAATAIKALLMLPALLFIPVSHATPLLRCLITYAGTTHTWDTAPGTDPYSVESMDIGGRFRFKAVVLGAGERIDIIKLYAYYETRRQPVLMHQVKYTPPFATSDSPYALTGLNYLYSPPLGRELQYGCAIVAVKS
jgi:hypothetical protein